MRFIPGENEALCRAHTMRSLRDEGATLLALARFFGYSTSTITTMIKWHERVYPIMPAHDEVGLPTVLEQFRANKPP